MNVPAVFLPAGAMLRGNWGGKILGSGSDVWKFWAEKEAGRITEKDWKEMEAGIARSFGTCMTMGTASTMAGIVEAMGMMLPGAGSIPAADSGHSRMATDCGVRIVDMVWEDLKPKDILTANSFHNAIVALMAMAGSTNGIIHILAMARRAGVNLTLEDFEKLSNEVGVIANLRPSGEYLMEDFHYAGGFNAFFKTLLPHLKRDELTVTGRTIAENVAEAKVWNEDVIRPLDKPIAKGGGIAVLRGNLAPNGCIIKPTAAEERLLKHTGPAIVFDDYNAMSRAVNDENLDVTPDHVMVLRNAGPVGGPGMPEWGMLPIPKKLLKHGRARHGAHLRRAHERHELRRLHPARRAGGLYRRSAGGGAQRRPDHGRRGGAERSGSRFPTPNWRTGWPPTCRSSGPRYAATSSCTPPMSPRPTRAATTTSWKGPIPSRSRRFTEAWGAPSFHRSCSLARHHPLILRSRPAWGLRLEGRGWRWPRWFSPLEPSSFETPREGAWLLSDCVWGQALCHCFLSLRMALAIVRSFLATATSATILGLPAAIRRS